MSKPLTLREAMQALVDGKKIRRSWYGHGQYVYFKGHELLDNFESRYKELANCNIEGEYCWELYEEPVPEKKIAPGWIDFKVEKPEEGRPFHGTYEDGFGFIKIAAIGCISVVSESEKNALIAWKYI